MNTYKEFINAHGITLDPRGVQIYVDWLLACENDTQARKIGEAMQAAIDNYCDNLNFEGECRITNALCTHCKEVETND